jgi:pSer/pThr/pTyr-binding forkhead associated (FHA) protein
VNSDALIPPTLSATPEPQARVTSPSLVVVGSGRRIRLPPISAVYLGRRDEKQNIYPHIDLTQDNGMTYGVSRRHACIHQSDDGIYIEDLGSSNGTFLNSQRLQPSQVSPLHHGDTLHLGQLQLEVALLP